ncbi:MAG: DUF1501 domain-containing protein, partial [Myxococcota bacterium]
ASGLTVLGGGTMLGRLARAAATPIAPADRYFIFCYFAGGWDILLSLDPRDPALFNDATAATTKINPGYNQLALKNPVTTPSGIVFGPYIGGLAAHHDKICVIRGMSMETLTHDVGRRRFLTGRPPSGLSARGTSAASWLTAKTGGEAHPLPNIAMRVESYNVDVPSYATALKTNSVADLLRALSASDPALAPQLADAIDALLSAQAECRTASPMLVAAEASRKRAATMAQGGLSSLFNFGANTPEMAELRNYWGFGANDLASGPAQAAMAARAIMNGVSRCVSIQPAAGLDTHSAEWVTDQGPRQKAGFDAVAKLMDTLAAEPYDDHSSWLDHTTIVGFSEFSRTPLINARGGRDHSLTNACFVAGGGVRGGTIVGRSSDIAMTPTTMNLTTGLYEPDGAIIRPEHVWQAIYESVGMTIEADLRVPPLKAAFTT